MTDLAALHDLVRAPGVLDLAAVARYFAESLDADGAVVLVVNPDRSELAVGAAHPPAGGDERALLLPVGYGVTGLVALNGRPITMAADSPRNEVLRRLLRLEPGDAVARLCVAARGMGSAAVAVVAVHRPPGRPFTDADVAGAQRCADLVGLRLHAEGLHAVAEGHRSQRDALIAQAITAQEAERRRIAGDLHDGVTQALASLAFHLSAADVGLAELVGANPAAAGARDQIQQARRLAGLAYDETRSAISGLHSLLLDDLGLVAALESLTQNVPQVDIELRADPPEALGEVPEHGAAVLYRIAQEAVNNVVKHSGAARAVLSLRRVGDVLVLGVSDDGVGFDVGRARGAVASGPAGEHYGLSSVTERCALIGASLRIESAPGRGTAVMVELPLPSAGAGQDDRPAP